MQMISKILQVLRSKNGPISKKNLLHELRIEEDAIGQYLRTLHDKGYEITHSQDGYTLVHSPDALFPWEFPGRESKIHYFKELSSTMDTAREMAHKGCPSFTVVIADSQSKGRGRLQRVWQSTRGGLYFTIVLRPDIPPAMSFKVNFAASYTLIRVLNKLYSINAHAKWPNDTLVDGLKLSGMLSEMETEEQKVSFINIGIGINVNNDPTLKEPNATFLKKLLGREIQRREILSRFIDDFQEVIENQNLENIIAQWKKHTITLKRHVKIVTTSKSFEGYAKDVDENGALVLELADGTIQKVIYGDCFH